VGSDDKEMEMLDKAETFQDGQPVSSRSVMKEVHEARDTRFDIGDTIAFGGRKSHIRGVPVCLTRGGSVSAGES
jgi:hypothetical protein